MLKIPAIDVMDGKIVRLSKGEYDSVVKYDNSPLEQAKIYDNLGFEWLHMVDLSGSKNGKINTQHIVEEIKSNTNLKIEFGGGIRSKKDVVNLNDIGVDGIIIGSLSVTNKKEFESIFSDVNPNKIIIAADVLDYNVRIKGWTEDSNIHLFDHIEYCSNLGIDNYLCTDIAVDGMLTGPSYNLYTSVLEKYPNVKLTASGGVSCMHDVIQLTHLPLRGVVIGKAIYENKINIEELVKLAV
ncbi:MAG: 1-(5-phosphoribosyl)-5-[(5-phosphoribosylamino)methylideneamino]imidazole-4-carboxamide isomerase [Ignavibacteriae bacterium]|nr:1-(5-phosphoribosyl)-5-[(5-phosphoribosylamino)methylideneamino]imidazole-4-carboxamide isomerase [Ignavibacteriota bacterium]MCB9208643.1 1-(5-phosphoribosyl)-5-[(5-phosphoribosylamino)methylideneamino]imidazole-4-carboxamide isomerase [Ignavibacteriales bacterium]MCB9258246.1 1-(5-phosphoribosyl)-5-[(5-phosphoribosylamino)methylideneamino]imidazole-4-carboxamide isomerase [Ignavibacteriales bacterium]